MVQISKEIIVLDKDEFRNIVRTEVDRAIVQLQEAQSKKNSKTYLSRKDTAKKIGVSLPTLWALDKKGKLPAHRVGGKVLYELGQIVAFVEGSNSKKTTKNTL